MVKTNKFAYYYLFTTVNGIDFRMTVFNETISKVQDLGDSEFLGCHIFLEFVKFTLQYFHVLQIGAKFIRGNESFLYSTTNFKGAEE